MELQDQLEDQGYLVQQERRESQEGLASLEYPVRVDRWALLERLV